jgi:integrase
MVPRVYKHRRNATVAGKKVVRESKAWYYDLTDPSTGKRVRHRGLTDFDATQALAIEEQRRAERIHAGIESPASSQRFAIIEELIPQWLASLESRGCGKDHLKRQVAKLERVCKECEWKRVKDIRQGDFEGLVNRWRKKNKTTRLKFSGMSAQTLIHYYRAVRAFGQFLMDRGIVLANPIREMQMQQPATDRRLIRRTLTEEEFNRLLATTIEVDRTRANLDASDRRLLYLAASWTGLRLMELLSIRFCDLVEGAIVLDGGRTKNGKEVRQPVPGDLLQQLQSLRRGQPATTRVWEPARAVSTAITPALKADLDDAGIPFRTPEGQADFHSLRGLYITRLALAGVPLAVTQKLARHSDPKITMNVYTRLGLTDLGAAVQHVFEKVNSR